MNSMLKSNKPSSKLSVQFTEIEPNDDDDEVIDDDEEDEEEEEEEEIYEDELNDEDEEEIIYEEEEEDDEEDEEEEDDEEDVEDEDIDEHDYDNIVMVDNTIFRESVRVPDNERITRKVLNKYELARLLGTRTQQIISGAPSFVACINGKAPMQIAIDELLNKRIPMEIIRPLPYFKYEVFSLDELEIHLTQDDIDGLIEVIKL